MAKLGFPGRLALASLLILLAPVAALADVPDGLANRAWSITDVVLARSINPPARQQMLLMGLLGLMRVGGAEASPQLALEVSAISAPDQYAAVLRRCWPAPGHSATAGQLEAALIGGMLSIVPGDADLISARDLRVAEQVEGNLYVGIQIAASYDDKAKQAVVGTVMEGGPADKAGAKDGDRIEAVDGVNAVGLPLKEVIDRLRGPLGTPVVVRLRREKDPTPIDRTMIRNVLPRKTVEGLHRLPGGGWKVRLDGPSPIAYLKIKEVVGSTPAELATFADQLETEGLKALVLDFRGLGHSNLHSAKLLADALLDGGTIGRIRSADSVETVRARPDSLFRRWPLAILVGEGMPAEARWVCAALEDNTRAVIFGDPAGPEPLVRSAVALPGGEWSVEMATGRLERGDGRPFPMPQKSGRRPVPQALRIDPNYASPLPDTSGRPALGRPILARPDDLLGAAQEALSRKLKETGA